MLNVVIFSSIQIVICIKVIVQNVVFNIENIVSNKTFICDCGVLFSNNSCIANVNNIIIDIARGIKITISKFIVYEKHEIAISSIQIWGMRMPSFIILKH